MENPIDMDDLEVSPILGHLQKLWVNCGLFFGAQNIDKHTLHMDCMRKCPKNILDLYLVYKMLAVSILSVWRNNIEY